MSQSHGFVYGSFSRYPEREKLLLSLWAISILPLLMLFPRSTGWISSPLVICGIYILVKYKSLQPMDRLFAVFCLILPASFVFNMLFMGWEPDALARPSHLIAAFFIYLVIGRYGLRRDILFWSVCAASLVAFCIAIFEAVYLGNERVFGLSRRWNAVPFGNFSLLISFFCLAGALVSSPSERHPWHRLAFGIVGFVLGFGASILSGTRGGWLAIPFLILLCLWFNNRMRKQVRVLVMAVLVISIAGGMAFSDRFASRFEAATTQVNAYLANPDDPVARDTSTGIRLAMWRWGMERFLEHPFTGIGFSSYDERREEAVAEGELPGQFKRLANLHNELITRLAMGGIPAALAVLIFWFIGWRFFASKLDEKNINDQYYYALCGLLTLVGTGLFSMTESLFGTSPGTKSIMLLLAIPAGAMRYAYVSRKNDTLNTSVAA